MPDEAASAVTSRLKQAAAAMGLLALAVAALLSGTDRQSREFPNTPSFVGWPYDTGAARARAITLFVKSGPQSAIGFARRAILSDPISAQPISLLGRSQLYSAQAQEARKTFEVAAQLGWRDAMTQIYWLDQALQSGDIKVAAERLDALLRQNPSDENKDRFLGIVSATPEGRAALANRLKAHPTWTETYVSDVSELPAYQLSQRVDVVLRAGKGVWDCPSSAVFVQRLIDTSMLREAQSVWHENCGASNSFVFDGGFDQLDTTRPTQGFDWQLSTRGDVDVRSVSDLSGQRSLDLEVTGTRSMLVLRQLIVLPPGTYQLSWRTPDTPAAAARAIAVSLDCDEKLENAEPGTPDGTAKDRYVMTFTVDAACPARKLAIWLAPRSPVHLDDVALHPLP